MSWNLAAISKKDVESNKQYRKAQNVQRKYNMSKKSTTNNV